MTNGFRDLLVGGGEPIYVKLKEVEKLAVRHFKYLAMSGSSQHLTVRSETMFLFHISLRLIFLIMTI